MTPIETAYLIYATTAFVAFGCVLAWLSTRH